MREVKRKPYGNVPVFFKNKEKSISGLDYLIFWNKLYLVEFCSTALYIGYFSKR